MADQRHRFAFPRVLSSAESPWANGNGQSHLRPADTGYDTPGRVDSPAPHPLAPPKLTIPGEQTFRFISLCILWYSSSALSSNTGKVIMTSFRFPVTLTIVQFFFVAGYCKLLSYLGLTSPLKPPSRANIESTLPMAAFQVGGHICSSLAISRVPVSTVHTIKALSPMVTVLAYAVLFSVSYSPATYISLLPLTLGVMLTCASDMSVSNTLGLICAFGSTIIFVSQNIFFKKIMPTNSETTIHGKLDKINLLYYSSGMAFILMVPVWIYSDWTRLWTATPTWRIGIYFFLNGSVHFAQNLLAFAILSSVSPVTYSIASLVKRIAVICLAFIWFKQAVHPIQGIGITLTALGLWMYNNAKRDVEKGEKRMRRVEALRDGLPQSKTDLVMKNIHNSPKPTYAAPTSAVHHSGFQLPPPVKPPPDTRNRRMSNENGETFHTPIEVPVA